MLNQMRDRIHKIAIEHGWWEKDRKLAEIIVLLHTELSEWFEAYRKGDDQKQCDKNISLTCEEEEIADVFIRLLDYCGYKKIDVERILNIKIEYNDKRPYRHGNKKA